MIWITADHHFDHTNIIKYCDRPFDSVEEMNEQLIAAWNRMVGPLDLVYHLGDLWIGPRNDIGFNRLFTLRHRLNGMLFLLRGNHDRLSFGEYRSCGINVLQPEPGPERGMFFLRYPTRTVVLSHRPPANYVEANRVMTTYGAGTLWLHGHSHGKAAPTHPHVLDVGVDVPTCFQFGRPFTLEYYVDRLTAG